MLRAIAVFWVVAGVVLTGCASPEQEISKTQPDGVDETESAVALRRDEITELFDNMTLKREGSGWVWHALFLADGTMRGRAEWPGGGVSATGVWEVTEDGLFCRDWDNNWGGGGRGCFKLYRHDGDLVQIYQHGSVGRFRKSRLEMLQGNPAGL